MKERAPFAKWEKKLAELLLLPQERLLSSGRNRPKNK